MIPAVMPYRFGQWLRAARLDTIDEVTRKPITQARLAELAQMSTSKIAMLERESITTVSPEDAHTFARVLNRPESEIIGALGFDVGESGLTEDERDLLAAYRRLRNVPILQQGALRAVQAMPAVLGPLPQSRPRGRQTA